MPSRVFMKWLHGAWDDYDFQGGRSRKKNFSRQRKPSRRARSDRKWKNKIRRQADAKGYNQGREIFWVEQDVCDEEFRTKYLSKVEGLEAFFSVLNSRKSAIKKYKVFEKLDQEFQSLSVKARKCWEDACFLTHYPDFHTDLTEECKETIRLYDCCPLCRCYDPLENVSDQQLLIKTHKASSSYPGVLCVRCIKNAFKRIADRELNVEPKCECSYSCRESITKPTLLTSGITVKQIENRERIILERVLVTMDGVRFCPAVGCGAAVFLDEEKKVCSDSKCPECEYEFCSDCNEPSHPEITCDGLKHLQFKERWISRLEKLSLTTASLVSIYGLVREIARDSKRLGEGMRCTGCRNFIWKRAGCLHMTCRFCTHEFYFCCGMNYRGAGAGCKCNQLASNVQIWDDAQAVFLKDISDRVWILWPKLLDRMHDVWGIDWSLFCGHIQDISLAYDRRVDNRGIRFVEVSPENSSKWFPAELVGGLHVRFKQNGSVVQETTNSYSVIPPFCAMEREESLPALRLLLPDISIFVLKFKGTHLAKISQNGKLSMYTTTTHRVALPRTMKFYQLSISLKKFLDLPVEFDTALFEYAYNRRKYFRGSWRGCDIPDVSRMRGRRLPVIQVGCLKDEIVCVLHTQVGQTRFNCECQSSREVIQTKHMKGIVCVKATRDAHTGTLLKRFQDSIFEAGILSRKAYGLYAFLKLYDIPTKEDLAEFRHGNYSSRTRSSALRYNSMRRKSHFICRFVPLGDPLRIELQFTPRFSTPVLLTLQMRTVQNIQDLLVCATEKLQLDETLKLEPVGVKPAAKAALQASLCTKLTDQGIVTRTVKPSSKAKSSTCTTYLSIKLITVPRIKRSTSSINREEKADPVGEDDIWEEFAWERYDRITHVRANKKKHSSIMRKSAVSAAKLRKAKRVGKAGSAVDADHRRKKRRKKNHRGSNSSL